MIDTYNREFTQKEYDQLCADDPVFVGRLTRCTGVINDECQRCLNTAQDYLHTFVHENEHITYCRKCLDFGMISTATTLYRTTHSPQILPETGLLNKDFQLSFLQVRASNFAMELLDKKETGMVWAVCGAGKTEMMFESIAKALTNGKRVCWAIPRADVVIDLAPRIKQAFPNAKVVTLHGNSEEKQDYGDIVVTTVHQMIRFYQAFDFLIIDEVDAFPYTFDEMLVRIAKRACKTDSATIYLSATPAPIDQRLIKEGKLPAVIIPARFHLFPLDIPVFKWCPNFYQSVSKKKLPFSAKRWLAQKIKSKRRALLFVPTIACGHHFQQALARCLDLTVPFVFSSDEQRLEKVADFKNGVGQFLITTMILERGVTIPDIDVGIFAAEHEIYEESALVQISGRVGRHPKWPTGDIVFFHHGVTLAMVQAREQMLRMNKVAKSEGLLREGS